MLTNPTACAPRADTNAVRASSGMTATSWLTAQRVGTAPVTARALQTPLARAQLAGMGRTAPNQPTAPPSTTATGTVAAFTTTCAPATSTTPAIRAANSRVPHLVDALGTAPVSTFPRASVTATGLAQAVRRRCVLEWRTARSTARALGPTAAPATPGGRDPHAPTSSSAPQSTIAPTAACAWTRLTASASPATPGRTAAKQAASTFPTAAATDGAMRRVCVVCARAHTREADSSLRGRADLCQCDAPYSGSDCSIECGNGRVQNGESESAACADTRKAMPLSAHCGRLRRRQHRDRRWLLCHMPR